MKSNFTFDKFLPVLFLNSFHLSCRTKPARSLHIINYQPSITQNEGVLMVFDIEFSCVLEVLISLLFMVLMSEIVHRTAGLQDSERWH